jgi:LAGLIDADG endonuclease
LATVITNLLSAIPIFGPDLVELIWGGLCRLLNIEEPDYSDIIMQILLIARITPNLGIGYFKFYNYYKIINVKNPITWSKPAEIRNKSYFLVSQRLNAEDLSYAYLVGLIEGDGWFSISKKVNYLIYEFGIELNIRNVQLIYKIKNLLGVGNIKFRKTEGRIETVILTVRNKKHLKDIILPIFDKYLFLSNKQYDYLRFKNSLLSGIKFYKDLTHYIRPNKHFYSIDDILSVSYFSAWLIGFIEAESCFSIYKSSKSKEFIASFEITQINEEILIKAITKYLRFTSKVKVDKTNNFKIKVSSIRSIENIIKFMHNNSIKLLGYKKLQYLLWLKELRTIKKYYEKINIPKNY